MARLGKIFIDEILVKTHDLNRAEMGALHMKFIFIICFWLTDIPMITTVT